MSVEKGIRRVTAVFANEGARSGREEDVVVEEPLEIRIAGESMAMTMRTPGDDRSLALGFLFAEGLVRSLADVGGVYHCGRMDDSRYGNVIEVVPGPGVSLDVDLLAYSKRLGITQSACGICGRDNIDDLLSRLPTLDSTEGIDAALLARAPSLLAQAQNNFARTGGLHAACAVTMRGRIAAHAEDVGRHNAVDKVVGKLLCANGLPRNDVGEDPVRLLVVSGRASFEIVQKAAMAGFVCVASVSAASSLAIDTARATGVTLAAFVREGRFTLYTHEARVR